MKPLLAAGLVALGLAVPGGFASAQQAQTLRVSTYLPSTHWLVSDTLKQWAENVKTATKGKLELLYPLGENSPIAAFLQKNSAGGIHHFCLEVEDIDAAIEQAKAHDIRILGNGSAKIGAHGKPVIFIHPKDALGCLVEFEEC